MKGRIALFTGAVALAASAIAFAAPALADDGGLTIGEYACYGSGGTLLIGAGFKVTDDSRYTDLDNTTSGTYAIDGDTVTFTDAHLDGQVGHDLQDGRFTLHEGVSCEPF
jgi:hypothetical protein